MLEIEIAQIMLEDRDSSDYVRRQRLLYIQRKGVLLDWDSEV